MKLIPTERYPNLIQLINITYTDEVEQILSAGVDDSGAIVCLAQDGNKRLAIKIGDDDIQIRLSNPQAVTGQTAQMAAPEEFAPDLVDSYVDQLKQQFPFKPWLQQAKELLMQSPNLEDYSTKLVDMYPEMPSDDFNQIMLDALTAASMAGYFDAESEMGEDAEFKLPEGSTRRRNGVNYVLQGSRWHRSEVEGGTTGKLPQHERNSAIFELVDKFESDLDKIGSGAKAEDYRSIGDQLIHGLMELGDRDTAEERAKKIDISEVGWESDRVQTIKDAADFYQLINKDLGIAKISPKDCTRACARLQDDSIGLPDNRSTRKRRVTQFHEMAHFGEFRDPAAGERAEEWVRSRAAGAVTPLSELTGNLNYRADETAVPDNFVHPYVGKLYGNGITEVHSVGLQHFADGRKLVQLFKQDREHFDLMIRYIRL